MSDEIVVKSTAFSDGDSDVEILKQKAEKMLKDIKSRKGKLEIPESDVIRPIQNHKDPNVFPIKISLIEIDKENIYGRIFTRDLGSKSVERIWLHCS